MLLSFPTNFQVLLLLLNFFLTHGGIHQVFLFQLHDLKSGIDSGPVAYAFALIIKKQIFKAKGLCKVQAGNKRILYIYIYSHIYLFDNI